jgi:hypothetical protein
MGALSAADPGSMIVLPEYGALFSEVKRQRVMANENRRLD